MPPQERKGEVRTMVDKDYTNPALLWSSQELAARLHDPNLRITDVRPTPTLVQAGGIARPS
jgi:hypothetical protein